MMFLEDDIPRVHQPVFVMLQPFLLCDSHRVLVCTLPNQSRIARPQKPPDDSYSNNQLSMYHRSFFDRVSNRDQSHHRHVFQKLSIEFVFQRGLFRTVHSPVTSILNVPYFSIHSESSQPSAKLVRHRRTLLDPLSQFIVPDTPFNIKV